jgi:hypothetical protein
VLNQKSVNTKFWWVLAHLAQKASSHGRGWLRPAKLRHILRRLEMPWLKATAITLIHENLT